MRDIYKRVAPHIDRVRYDGGTETRNMSDLFQLQRLNEELKDFLKLSYCPELTGNKIRVSGVNNYISKGYSTDAIQKQTGNDLTQSTAVNQPYLDKIAPTEKMGAKNPNGGGAYLTHPTISFGASDEWTVETVLNWNDSSDSYTTITGGSDLSKIGIKFSNGYRIYFANSTANETATLPGTTSASKYVAKSSIFTIVGYGNGIISFYLNGILLETKAANGGTTCSFNALNNSASRIFYGKIHSHHIFNKVLSANQIAQRASVLRSIFPEIESVQIGTQTWAVRNFEAVCTPQGNLIPEVQSAATWSGLSTLAWCHYGNDPANGAIYGKLYNGYARDTIKTDLLAGSFGWHIATKTELQSIIDLVGVSALKENSANYWTNTNGNNQSGLTLLGGGYRNTSGTDSSQKALVKIWCNDVDEVLTINNDNSYSFDVSDKKTGAYIRLLKN